jgi:hypothetical protein
MTEPAVPPITAPTILLGGDPMTALRPLSQLPNVTAMPPHPPRPFRRRAIRAVATGIDTSTDAELTPLALKARLRRELLASQRLCD